MQYEERLASRSGDGNFLVMSVIPASPKATAVPEVKKLLGVGTASALDRLKKLPLAVPVDSVVEAKVSMERLRADRVQCHLKLEFF